jgi:hypothetical protein
MLHQFQNLLSFLDDDLLKINESDLDRLIKAEQSFKAAKKHLDILRQYLCDHEFYSPEEEICYFKVIQPTVLSQVFYFCELRKHETQKIGTCNGKTLKKYYKDQINAIAEFLNIHHKHFIYFKTKSSHNDKRYFLRSFLDLNFIADECLMFVDTSFTTGYDILFSKFIAYERLSTFLNTELQILTSAIPFHTPFTSCENNKLLPWPSPKVDLVELSYAIYYATYKKKNNFTINDVYLALSKGFDVKIPDVNRKFMDIKSRHNPTKYIDNMKDSIMNEINNDDD